MKGNQRRFLAGLTATALAATLVGCAGQASNDDDSGSKSFTMWSMWSEGEPNQILMESAITEFEKETGITVNVVWKGRSPVSKLLPALNSATPPADLVDSQDTELVIKLGGSGNAADLSAVYDETIPGEDQTVGSVLNPAYKEDLTTDGKVFMVPYQVYTYSFFYNAALHPEIAAGPPQSWEDLDALFAASKEAGTAAPIALEGSIPPFPQFWTTAMILNSLGKGAYRAAVEDTTGQTWLEPGYKEVAEQIESWVDKEYFIADYMSSKYPEVQQQWAANKADYMYNGTWIPVETAPYAAEGFEYASFAFPVSGDASRVMEIAFNGLAVVEKSKNKEAATQFISWFLQKKYQDELAQSAKGIPARTDVEPDPSVASAVETLNSSTIVIAGDNVPWDDYNAKVFQPNNQELFAGKITASEFVQRLADQSAAYWAANEQ